MRNSHRPSLSLSLFHSDRLFFFNSAQLTINPTARHASILANWLALVGMLAN